MEYKHTPGPWINDPKIGAIFGPDGKPIQTGGEQCEDETRSNAFLIAAAPDLLEAAIEALEHFNKYVPDLHLDCKDSLRMAIAKAWLPPSDSKP